MTGIKSVAEFDNKITYIVGYRNLYNIAVLFIALMMFLNPDATSKVLSLVVVVLGLKWMLTQVRENIDVVRINEMAFEEARTLNIEQGKKSKD
jgi:hypothetical protein